MLKTFKVRNFRGFKDEVIFDLSQAGGYDFNKQLVKENFVNKALIYGKNGSGKSNLGLALCDIVPTLTNKWASNSLFTADYRNLDNPKEQPAEFTYVLKFGDDEIEYHYSKMNISTLVVEELKWNGKQVLFCRHSDKTSQLVLDYNVFPELKSFSTEVSGNQISVIKNIATSSYLKKDGIIDKLVSFANGFLWFRSLREGNDFTGFHENRSLIEDTIISAKKIADFETFLRRNELSYHLEDVFENGRHVLYAKYEHGSLHFSEVISSGTSMLELIYCWSLNFNSALQFLFIDEFDAYFHYEAAANIFALLAKNNSFQSVLTSHDTYLMQNTITRPDCVFLMSDNHCIKSLNQCTEREIRVAHNVEKLYRNGAFCE